MSFYLFLQNNSGGGYDLTDKLDVATVFEARSAAEANERAEEAGIYFEGVAANIDCYCCGDRWSPVDESDAFDTLNALNERYDWISGGKLVHYADGRVERRDVLGDADAGQRGR